MGLRAGSSDADRENLGFLEDFFKEQESGYFRSVGRINTWFDYLWAAENISRISIFDAPNCPKAISDGIKYAEKHLEYRRKAIQKYALYRGKIIRIEDIELPVRGIRFSFKNVDTVLVKGRGFDSYFE